MPALRSIAALLLSSLLAACAGDEGDLEEPTAAVASAVIPSSFSLAQYQTSHKDQLDRDHCWAFAGIAALEAVYKRKYGLDLDLSEQYFVHLSKSSEYIPTNRTENNSSLWGFQNDALAARQTRVLRLPEERFAGYRTQTQMESSAWAMPGAFVAIDIDTATQSSVDRVEQSQEMVPVEAGYHARYGATGMTELPGPNGLTTQQIIGAIASTHEVVVDMTMQRKILSDGTWDWDPNGSTGQHVMLVIGYDIPGRYFILKNSHGSDQGAFIHATFDYVQHAYLQGGYVDDVIDPGSADIPQATWMGRWTLGARGLNGRLYIRRYTDVNHNPSLDDNVSAPMGALYQTNGTVTAVRGSFTNGGRQLNMLIGNELFTFGISGDRRITDGQEFVVLDSLLIPIGPARLERASYWLQQSGCVKQIAVGNDPDRPWVLGCTAVPGGWQILKRNAAGGFDAIPGFGAMRIAAERNTDTLWVTTDNGTILEWTGHTWRSHPGCARDIAAGATSAQIWVVGCGANGAGQDLFDFNPATNSFTLEGSGAFRRVAVSPNNRPWALDASGNIFRGVRFLSWDWQQQHGCAGSISVGDDDMPWVIGCGGGNQAMYRMTGNGEWEAQPGAAVEISVSKNGMGRWVGTAGGSLFSRIPPFND